MADQDDIAQLVQTVLHTKIIQAFHDAPEAIDRLVEAALSHEVSEHGGKPDAFSRKRMPYLEWIVGETIRSAARSAVQDVVKEREAEIRDAVRQALTAEKIVDGLIAKILGAIDQDFRVTVQFADEDRNRR